MYDFLSALDARLRADAPDDIMVDMTDMAFASFRRPVAAAGVIIVAGDAAGAYFQQDAVVGCFTVALAATGLALAELVRRFKTRRTRKTTARGARRWQYRYAVLAIAFCIELSVVNLRYFSIRDQTGEYLSTLAIFGIFAVISGRLGFVPWIGRCCAWVMFGIMALAFLISGIPNAPVMSAFVLMVAYTYLEAEGQKFTMLVEQLRYRQQLSGEAQTDVLSGLANTRKFREVLNDACARREDLALLMIDLNLFKSVNDRFGHAIGDQVLQLVAARLKRLCRTGDLVARIGGDEFAILQIGRQVPARDATVSAKIVESLGAPFNASGRIIQIGASVGRATSAVDGHDPEKLLAHADADMYVTKTAAAARRLGDL